MEAFLNTLPQQSSCAAALKHNPDAASNKWPTHSATNVSSQISVCRASLQTSGVGGWGAEEAVRFQDHKESACSVGCCNNKS